MYIHDYMKKYTPGCLFSEWMHPDGWMMLVMHVHKNDETNQDEIYTSHETREDETRRNETKRGQLAACGGTNDSVALRTRTFRWS